MLTTIARAQVASLRAQVLGAVAEKDRAQATNVLYDYLTAKKKEWIVAQNKRLAIDEVKEARAIVVASSRELRKMMTEPAKGKIVLARLLRNKIRGWELRRQIDVQLRKVARMQKELTKVKIGGDDGVDKSVVRGKLDEIKAAQKAVEKYGERLESLTDGTFNSIRQPLMNEFTLETQLEANEKIQDYVLSVHRLWLARHDRAFARRQLNKLRSVSFNYFGQIMHTFKDAKAGARAMGKVRKSYPALWMILRRLDNVDTTTAALMARAKVLEQGLEEDKLSATAPKQFLYPSRKVESVRPVTQFAGPNPNPIALQAQATHIVKA